MSSKAIKPFDIASVRICDIDILVKSGAVGRDSEYGSFDASPNSGPEITVSDRISGRILGATVLHESIHAIDDMFQLDLSEQQVRALEVALCSLIRNNPVLIRAVRA